MKSLVTGGCGFIGSHMVDRLLAEGHEVIVIDNCSTGRMENLIHHKDNPRLQIFCEDICNHEKISPLFEGVDWVFHMAALADIVPSIQNPVAYFHSNVDGTFSVVRAAKAANVKRFLYTASSSCYGIPDTYPTNESAEIRPQYPYALTKRLGEEIALHWAAVYKLPVVSCAFSMFTVRAPEPPALTARFSAFFSRRNWRASLLQSSAPANKRAILPTLPMLSTPFLQPPNPIFPAKDLTSAVKILTR